MISALVLAALISASPLTGNHDNRVEIVAPPERALCDFGSEPTKPCYIMGVTIDNGAGVGLTLHDDMSDSTITIMGVPSGPGTFSILGILSHESKQLDHVRYGVCLKREAIIQCSGQYANQSATFSVKVQLLP